jgi:hypothetical protein
VNDPIVELVCQTTSLQISFVPVDVSVLIDNELITPVTSFFRNWVQFGVYLIKRLLTIPKFFFDVIDKFLVTLVVVFTNVFFPKSIDVGIDFSAMKPFSFLVVPEVCFLCTVTECVFRETYVLWIIP